MSVDATAEQAHRTASSAADSANNAAANAERSFSEAARRFEQAVHEGVEQIRAQTRAYGDTAAQQLDEAQRYMTERVKERPLAMTGAAVGVGVLVGLLLAGGRRR